MGNIIEVEVFVKTNKVGSECTDTMEFDRDEWEAMTDEERDKACQDVAFNYMEWGWRELN